MDSKTTSNSQVYMKPTMNRAPESKALINLLVLDSMNSKKLDRIKLKIRSGTYQVDSRSVARSIRQYFKETAS